MRIYVLDLFRNSIQVLKANFERGLFARRCLIWLALCLSIFGIYRFTQKKTEGFSLNKIQTSFTFDAPFTGDTAPLKQPYFYLGHGAQNFVFASADGQYVLKFYRHHRAHHPLERLIPFLPKLYSKKLHTTSEKRKNKRCKDVSSFCLAFRLLQQETGLVALYGGGSTPFTEPLTLYDPIGVRHQIDLNAYPFILQKRAKPLYATLMTWIDQGDLASAQEGLRSLITLLRSRCERGIADKDPNLYTNFGFLDKQAVQFDVGRFSLQTDFTQASDDQEELFRITAHLRDWLRNKEPSLEATILEEIYR